MEHALANKQISQEDFNNYQQAPWGKKTAVAHGLMANMHDDLLRQQATQEQANFTAKMAQAMQIARMEAAAKSGNDGGFTPEMVTAAQDAAGKVGKGFIQTTRGGGQLVDMPEQDLPVDPSKIRAIEIPGSGGLKVVLDEKGHLVKNAQLQGAVRPNPLAGLLAGAGGGIFGGGTFGADLNAAAAAQATVPQTGTTQQPRQLSPQDQQAVQWAQANPNDPRAVAILKKNGL